MIILQVAGGAAFPLLSCLFCLPVNRWINLHWFRKSYTRRDLTNDCLGTSIVQVIIWQITGHPLVAVGAGVSVVVAAAVWWYRRKRRDPAARQFGAKSRARLAALVEKAREAAQPRRVLKPVPGGAS